MTGSRAENLNRAAKLIRRMADIGGPGDFEGVSLSDIAHDCAMAAGEEKVREKVAELTENVVYLDTFSRKVGA